MAKKSNYTPIIVFAVLVLAVIGVGWWLLRGGGADKAAQAPTTVTPALPDGALRFAGVNVTEAHYLAADGLKRSGQMAQATVLVVGKTATAIAHQYALVAKRETLDCAGRTISNEMAGEYDATGKLRNNEILTGAIGRVIESGDFEAAAVCDAKPGPAWRAATGWRAAQREFQSAPDDIVTTAEANPKDAEAWASLCRNGARGHWRPKAPKDCDHAVGLQPADAATRLNRAYMNLEIGHNPAAQSDFHAVLARDANNPAALFGQSLVEAMAKNLSASKRDRVRALGLDPKVPDWVTTNFHILISDPYSTP